MPSQHATIRARGLVIAAARPAAEAGARMLDAGGNAADAAVATAAMLGVVDPQNCGIGGYGGFAIVDDGRSDVRQVAFNTTVPAAFDPQDPMPDRRPGRMVTPPAVVPGLARLHARFGRLRWRDCWEPAIAAARDGIPVGRDLSTALRWAHERHRGLNDAFRATFFASGGPPAEGTPLVQPDLAATLERVAAEGVDAIRRGPVAMRLAASIAASGGIVAERDLAALDAQVLPAARGTFGSASVFAADPEQSGAEILLHALATLDERSLGASRSETYVRRIGAVLSDAWARRDAAYELLAPPPAQTTHLSVADADGMLVALTFTHGPTWFGSGLVAEGTGVVLNNGLRLIVRRRHDGACLPQTNLTPTVLHTRSGRYALGTPGARRIPAVVLQLVLDLAHYRVPLAEALAAPRVSASADGTLDAEAPLVEAFPQLSMRTVVARDYYGPAGAVGWHDGVAEGTTDPRFAGACVAHQPL